MTDEPEVADESTTVDAVASAEIVDVAVFVVAPVISGIAVAEVVVASGFMIARASIDA